MKLEKFIPKRINKDVAPDAMDRGNNRVFLPGDLLDALNCCYESDGSDGIIKNRKGNVLKDYTLSSGENKVIGWFPDAVNNSIIYMIWNEFNDDRIAEYSFDTANFTTLLQGDLKFDKNYRISQGGVIDGNLLYNDALNRPRSISISKAKAGGYTAPYSEYEISLATRPPLKEPTVVKSTDATLPFNNITANTWQFTHRYAYHDNRLSTVGPLSSLVWIRPFVQISDTDGNAVQVTVDFPGELVGIVTRIEVIAREGNSNNYFIFNEIKNPTAGNHVSVFTNFGKKIVLSANEVNRLYDYIPDRTEGFEVLKDRVFTTLNLTGFDVDDSTFDIEVTLKKEEAPGPTLPAIPFSVSNPIPDNTNTRNGSYNNKMYLKGGGNYVVGVVFITDFGKVSFVKKQKRIAVPFDYQIGLRGERYYLELKLTGTPPAGMSRCRFVLSEELFYSSYFQCQMFPLPYYRDIGTDEVDNTEFGGTDGLYAWKGKVFYDTNNEIANGGTMEVLGLKYLYFQIPVNVPVVPDETFFIRFPFDFGVGITPVLGVVDGYLVVGIEPFRQKLIDMGTNVSSFHRLREPGVTAEIFKLRESSSPERFYEVGSTMEIIAGAFPGSAQAVYGDTYNLSLYFEAEYQYEFVTLVYDNTTALGEVDASFYERFMHQTLKRFVESPSGIFSATTSAPVTTATTKVNFFKSSLDYNKIASHRGRVHTVFDQEKQRDLYNVVGFSNPYVQQTFINGLNTYLAENQYPLPVERTRTRTLKRVGDVLSAIHESQTSTLYIGEGFIRQGNDFILAKTEGVVGDDRKLLGGFGTINPESVIEFYDQAVWWDGLRGAVVRQTKAGLFPISNYGLRNYFFNKAKELAPYRQQVKVVSAFDYAHDEYLITFSDVKNESGTIIIPGVTWAFNIKSEEWKTRFPFIPECYASVNQKLISFINGQLWVHFENPLCNNYYGVQYQRSFKTVVNGDIGKNKRFLNVHIDGDLCQDPESEFVPLRVYNKKGQESFTPAYEFEYDEGKWNGPILKDINTPNVAVDKLALRSGDDIVSNYIEVEVINDRSDESPCSQVNIVYVEEMFSI